MITLHVLMFITVGMILQSLACAIAASYYRTDGYHPFWGFVAPYGFIGGLGAMLVRFLINQVVELEKWDSVLLSFLVVFIATMFVVFDWTKKIDNREAAAARKERESKAVGFKRHQ